VRLPAGKPAAPVIFGEDAGLEGTLRQVMWVEEYRTGLVLATNGGGVEFSPRAGKVTRIWTAKDGLGNDRIRWAGVLNGELWAATIMGASRLLPRGRRWKNYGTAAGFPQGHIYRMIHDGESLWASSMNGGLARFSPGRGRWTVVPQVRGIGNRWIYAMATAPGEIWLGTAGGVNLYSTANESWVEEVCADGFTDYTVRAVAIAGKTLWFGACDGLHRRNIETGEQEIFTKRHGLPDNDVTSLRIVDGVLWITTTTGVAKKTL